MKVSLKWLNEYIDVPDDLKEFCDRLDLTGTEVEGIEKLGDNFDNIVTGQIVVKEKHPDADTLWVTKVDVGTYNVNEEGNPEPLQIVCGAQNFKQGDHVVVALIGAMLPGDFKIKKSKLRGVTSHGMNCSQRELGLGQDHDGIMILPEDAPIGVPFAEYMKLGDTVLDLEPTPNRPDCLSMTGVAREVGAMYQRDWRMPERALVESDELASDLVGITIDDQDRCPRYTARVIKDVKVGPSPDWLVERVTAAGARSINNIVDATNYILFELGQPLHAFDFDQLDPEGGKAHIIVRAAEEGEKFTTLDEEARTLKSDMTVIATPKRAVALAGVMGGLDSEVTDDTTTILLEAATFSTAHTSRTSRNLGLISEASMRYERGVDDHAITRNADLAAALIAELSGGTVCKGLVDEWPAPTQPIELEFRTQRFCDMVGATIEDAFIEDALTRLGCTVKPHNTPGTLRIVAPTFRPDLEREVDLYEEVLRLYGMDKVPSTMPAGRGRVGRRSIAEQKIQIIHSTLRASGLNETMTYSFAEPQEVNEFPQGEGGNPALAVELINPLNAEQSIMRQSIIPGLLSSVSYNLHRGTANIQLYEIGATFFAREGKKAPKEKQSVSGVLAGSMHRPGWNVDSLEFDFFDGKGIIESLARELAIPKLRFKVLEPELKPYLQPGRIAQVLSGGTVLGWVGEVHPTVAHNYEIDTAVVAFDLDLDALIKASQPARPYVEIPSFPAVEMDAAFVVDEAVTHEKMMQVMQSAGGTLLEKVALFDIYRDEEKLGAGKKSMAYAFTYRAADKTLTSEEVDKAHERLIKKVQGATGAEIRG